MGFEVDADAYDRFMGRYAEPLAGLFAGWCGIRPGHRVLDVGCGPGALTAELVRRLGPEAVSAIDPSASFVAAVRNRLPLVSVARGSAEHLPYPDASFDAVLAQLVVHFMSDPVAGLAEMARVARPGGVVAACVWDYGIPGQTRATGPLATFWAAVRELDPGHPDEAHRPGTTEGDLVALASAAGLVDPQPGSLTVSVRHDSFAAWWQPNTLGVGPAGDYVAQLSPVERDRLRARCAELLGPPPFTIEATAWCVRSNIVDALTS